MPLRLNLPQLNIRSFGGLGRATTSRWDAERREEEGGGSGGGGLSAKQYYDLMAKKATLEQDAEKFRQGEDRKAKEFFVQEQRRQQSEQAKQDQTIVDDWQKTVQDLKDDPVGQKHALEMLKQVIPTLGKEHQKMLVPYLQKGVFENARRQQWLSDNPPPQRNPDLTFEDNPNAYAFQEFAQADYGSKAKGFMNKTDPEFQNWIALGESPHMVEESALSPGQQSKLGMEGPKNITKKSNWIFAYREKPGDRPQIMDEEMMKRINSLPKDVDPMRYMANGGKDYTGDTFTQEYSNGSKTTFRQYNTYGNNPGQGSEVIKTTSRTNPNPTSHPDDKKIDGLKTVFAMQGKVSKNFLGKPDVQFDPMAKAIWDDVEGYLDDARWSKNPTETLKLQEIVEDSVRAYVPDLNVRVRSKEKVGKWWTGDAATIKNYKLRFFPGVERVIERGGKEYHLYWDEAGNRFYDNSGNYVGTYAESSS